MLLLVSALAEQRRYSRRFRLLLVFVFATLEIGALQRLTQSTGLLDFFDLALTFFLALLVHVLVRGMLAQSRNVLLSNLTRKPAAELEIVQDEEKL
jgi:hypothetical protein